MPLGQRGKCDSTSIQERASLRYSERSEALLSGKFRES